MLLLFRQFCRGLLSGRNKSVERRITDRYGFESFIRDVFSYFLKDVKNYFNKTASQDIREAVRRANGDDYEGLWQEKLCTEIYLENQ